MPVSGGSEHTGLIMQLRVAVTVVDGGQIILIVVRGVVGFPVGVSDFRGGVASLVGVVAGHLVVR